MFRDSTHLFKRYMMFFQFKQPLLTHEYLIGDEMKQPMRCLYIDHVVVTVQPSTLFVDLNTAQIDFTWNEENVEESFHCVEKSIGSEAESRETDQKFERKYENYEQIDR